MSYLDILKRAEEKTVPSWAGIYNKWHALFVHTGEEERVKDRLLYKFGNESPKLVIPRRQLKERKQGKWETKIRTLFPGYILINGHVGAEEYYMIKRTPGVIDILKDKSGPLVINEDEIRIISDLISEDEVIGPSNVYVNGSRIEVSDGPLLGMEGFIESINKRKGRAKVKLNFAGQPRVVELSVSMVQDVGDSNRPEVLVLNDE